MPLPGVTWPVRHEVGSSLVLHPLWESQQHPYVIVGGLWAVGSAVRQTHTCSGTKRLRKQTISARLFLISAQLRTKRSPKRLWRLKLNCKIIYWANQSHWTPTFPTQPKQNKKKCNHWKSCAKWGSIISSSPRFWRCEPFILWPLLTMKCTANYKSPSVGDCSKRRQEMKRLWGMRKEQIEQTTLLHHINSVPSAVGLGAPGQGAQQELSANTGRWN